jgi:hypothetical protein
MATQRLPPARVTGIVAWTAATVTWGTAAVALAAAPSPSTETTAAAVPLEPVVVENAVVTTTLAPVPTMPESGLVVLRYTPIEKPKAPVVVRRVEVAAPSTGTASGPASSTAPVKSPTKTKSAGS